MFKMWLDKNSVGGKGREGSLHIKQHPTGLNGSVDDIIFITAGLRIVLNTRLSAKNNIVDAAI